MLSPILAKKKSKIPKLVVLSETRKITEEDVKIHAKWDVLKEWYKQTDSAEWVDKAMQSIVNSIVYQERIFFCLEREKVRSLLKNDKNWSEPLGLSNSKYPHLLAELQDREIIKLVDDTKTPYIYELTDGHILDMIKVESKEEQLSQVIEFRDKNTNFKSDGGSDGGSDGLSDGESDVEYKNIRIEEKDGRTDGLQSNLKPTVNKIDLVEKEKSITFEELLFRETPDSFPFGLESLLAQLAIENCEDFNGGSSDLATLERFLKNQCRGGKPTPNQATKIKEICVKFERESKKALAIKRTSNIELNQPTELTVKSAIESSKQEDVIQNNTLNILKTTFGRDEIRRLNEKIKEEQDEYKAENIRKQIDYWERVLN